MFSVLRFQAFKVSCEQCRILVSGFLAWCLHSSGLRVLGSRDSGTRVQTLMRLAGCGVQSLRVQGLRV